MKNLLTTISRKEIEERMGMTIEEIKLDPYQAYQCGNRFRVDAELRAELDAVIEEKADDLLYAVAMTR